jgi:heat shock protein HtpX
MDRQRLLAHKTANALQSVLLVATLAGLLGLLAWIIGGGTLAVFALATGMDIPWLALLVLLAAPTLSALVQLALSRNREYEADLAAAELTGDPAVLASALDKLERYQGRFWEQILMPGRRVLDPSLLRTHPDTEDRVARLLSLVPQRKPLTVQGDAGLGPYAVPPRRPRYRPPGLWY